MSLGITETGDGRILVPIHVQPRATRSGVEGRHGDALKVRLQAPPVDGEANAELARLLAAALGVKAREVELVAGHASRRKVVAVSRHLRERVEALGGP